MADGTIGLPADDAGKKLDTTQLTVSGTTVQRERMVIAGTSDVDLTEVRNTDPTAADYGMVVRQAGPDSIQTATVNSTATAAGSSDTLDSTQVNSGKTAKLMQLIVSSSVHFKAELQTLTNGSASSTLLTLFDDNRNVVFTPVTKEAFTVAQDAGAGADSFRVVFTNLDTSEAADGYATFIYDEV